MLIREFRVLILLSLCRTYKFFQFLSISCLLHIKNMIDSHNFNFCLLASRSHKYRMFWSPMIRFRVRKITFSLPKANYSSSKHLLISPLIYPKLVFFFWCDFITFLLSFHNLFGQRPISVSKRWWKDNENASEKNSLWRQRF